MEEIEYKTKKLGSRSAVSLLIGLRQKFAKEMNKDNRSYTAQELHFIFSEALRKLTPKDVVEDFRFSAKYLDNNDYDDVEDDEIWGVIKKEIDRSNIKRYQWSRILKKKSLTQEILKLRNKGLDANEAFEELKSCEEVQNFIIDFPHEEERLIDNLRISVHARYGENNTSEKIKEAHENAEGDN